MLDTRTPAVRVLAAAAAAAALLMVAAAGPAGGTAVSQTVATGPPLTLGEPQAAADSRLSAVAATTFTFGSPAATSATARELVRVWARPTGARGWSERGSVLPRGFATSYDPAVAATPGGSLLVAVGAAPRQGGCFAGGSVALERLSPAGRLGRVRLVTDLRGSGRFADRPTVAVGPRGTVWAAWSEGPNSDACQLVGSGDRVMVAVSHDGGRSFGPAVALPRTGGVAAFGVRLAPLGGGRVAVSWTESTGAGREAALVATVDATGRVSPTRTVLTGRAPPRVLPGASFYDFPAVSLTALSAGRLAVAVPLWRDGRGVVELAVGTPGGRWRTGVVLPPPGGALLLPALAARSPTKLRLLCALHRRVGDRLGYTATTVAIGDHDTLDANALVPVTPSPGGPGFFEIGEELSLAPSPTGLLAAVVVAGRGGAVLDVESWRGRFTGAPHQARTAPAGPTSPAAGARRPTRTAVGGGLSEALVGAAALAAVTAAAAWVAVRRRSRTRRPHRAPRGGPRRPAGH